MNNKVIIIGADHHNALGVVESLGKVGIYSDLIILGSIKSSFVSKSKFVKESIIINNEQGIIPYLLKTNKDKDNRAVVIVTGDDIASLIDVNYAKLKDYLYCPGICGEGNLSELMSKQRMAEIATSVGLKTPKSWIIEKNQLSPEEVEFPCITKSIISVHNGKSDMRVFYNKESLDFFLANNRHSDIILIQKIIEKNFEFQFIGCSLDEGREIIIPGMTHIDRPKGIDNTFFLQYTKCDTLFDDTLKKVKRFIARTKYSGLFSIEFIHGADGIDYFLEMNFRNDGNAICVTASGTNLPYIWYLYNTGGNYKEEQCNSDFVNVYLMPEWYYFRRLIIKEISLSEWIKNMKKATCYTTYFKEDKRPFYFFLKRQLSTLLVSMFRKIMSITSVRLKSPTTLAND